MNYTSSFQHDPTSFPAPIKGIFEKAIDIWKDDQILGHKIKIKSSKSVRIIKYANCPFHKKIHDGWRCPAEWLNKSRYHENWLQNFLAAASMGGFRYPPPKPL